MVSLEGTRFISFHSSTLIAALEQKVTIIFSEAMGNSESQTGKLNAISPGQEDTNSSFLGFRNDTSRATAYKRLKTINRLMANNETHDAFLKFLASGAAEHLALLEDLESLRKVEKHDLKVCSNNIVRSFVGSVDTSNTTTRTFSTALENADAFSVMGMALTLYPKFIEYQNRKNQPAESPALPTKESSRSNSAEGKSGSKEKNGFGTELSFESYLSDGDNQEDEVARTKSIVRKAMDGMDKQELDRLFSSGSWLASLLVAVETLPICVSIATANSNRRGFPLIYVNNYFEVTSGYTREEIIGQNCRFLQGGKSEPESIRRLSTALREAKPVKVSITNFRKDGMPFRNLLAMKPIFDDSGEYRYVVGIQFDVSKEDATPAKLKLADELMKMLPDIIPVLSET